MAVGAALSQVILTAALLSAGHLTSLFDDHYEFPLWQPVAVSLSAILPMAWYLLGEPAGVAATLMVDLPQLAEFVFLGLALYSVFNSWRGDLVTARRALRLWFCGTLGVFILTLILARQFLFAGAPWLEFTQYLATAIIATGTNMILLRFRPGVLDPVQRDRPVQAEPDSAREVTPIEDELEPVIRLVEQEGIYREWGMTIGE